MVGSNDFPSGLFFQGQLGFSEGTSGAAGKTKDACWISGWWFQIFFIFIPTWGNDPIWRSYFSNGLKPSTRFVSGHVADYFCKFKGMCGESSFQQLRDIGNELFLCILGWWSYFFYLKWWAKLSNTKKRRGWSMKRRLLRLASFVFHRLTLFFLEVSILEVSFFLVEFPWLC